MKLKQIVLLLCVSFSVINTHAQTFYGASIAKRGNGTYKNSIFWINWDLNNNGRPNDIITATTRTVTTPSGITYTIQISNITTTIGTASSALRSYVPGQWAYDDMKTDYNWFNQAMNDSNCYSPSYNFATSTITNAYDSLTDAHNSVVGITNSSDGARIGFRITISATLGGSPINILGMVAIGAESLGSAIPGITNEYERFTTNGQAWQAFDRVQNNYMKNVGTSSASTTFNTVGDVSADGKTVTSRNPSTSANEGPGEMLWFSKGCTQMDVVMQGGGKQAVAIGFIGSFDYGDAPISYGDAGHQLDLTFDGGTPTAGQDSISLRTFPLATQRQPLSLIGSVIDIDATQWNSTNLLGDDNRDVDDEDGMANPYNSTVIFGQNQVPLTIAVKNGNAFPVKLHAWLDINLNGKFEASEKGGPVDIAAGYIGNVNIGINGLPKGFEAFTKYPLRLRMAEVIPTDNPATTNVDEGSFGIATSGEVEDHMVTVLDAPISGKLFNDNNQDGVLSPGETMYSGSAPVYVYLISQAGYVVSKALVTNGQYTIYGMPANTDMTSLGVKLLVSATNYADSTLLTTLDGVAPGGYFKTAEDLSASVSNVNNNGSVTDYVVSFTGTLTPTGVANVNFGLKLTSLPVNFGTISAKMVNGELIVDWTTLAEKNNAYFEIEASRDGKNFIKVGTVHSTADGGNSSIPISYNYKASIGTVSFLGISVLGILCLLVSGNRKRRIAMLTAMIIIVGAAGISCTKKDKFLIDGDGATYIRIKQVDIDGTVTYSKVVRVIEE